MRGLSISARHWCNNLGVFPLCAGVIVRDCEHREIFHGVSPACGGYRRESVLNSSTSACFPCVGVIGPDAQRTLASSQCFPCVRGLSVRIMWSGIMLKVFPLCAGVIGLKTITTSMITSVSPVWGLSAVGERAGSGGFVFPLCAGVIGRGTCTRRVRSGVSPAWGLSVPLWFRDYFHLVFPLCGGYRLVRNPAFHRR